MWGPFLERYTRARNLILALTNPNPNPNPNPKPNPTLPLPLAQVRRAAPLLAQGPRAARREPLAAPRRLVSLTLVQSP